MNEEALKDAYTLFKGAGYTKSIEEFKTLINTNENALNDAYSLFSDSGYTKPIDDFKTLVGVGEVETPSKEGKQIADSTESQSVSAQEQPWDLGTQEPSQETVTSDSSVEEVVSSGDATQEQVVETPEKRNLVQDIDEGLYDDRIAQLKEENKKFSDEEAEKLRIELKAAEEIKTLTVQDFEDIHEEEREDDGEDPLTNWGKAKKGLGKTMDYFARVVSFNRAEEDLSRDAKKEILREELAKERRIEPSEISPVELEEEYVLRRRQKLINKKEEAKIEEHIEDLEPESKTRLTNYFTQRKAELSNKSLTYLVSNESIVSNEKALSEEANEIITNIKAIEYSHKNGEGRLDDETIEVYKGLFSRLEEIKGLSSLNQSEFLSNVDDLNNVYEDLDSVSNELDLYKRNYGSWANMSTRLYLSLKDLGINAFNISHKYSAAGVVSKVFGDDSVKDFVLDQKEESERVRGTLRKGKELDNINSVEDFAEWSMDLISEQLPNTLLMAYSGGASLYVMGATSAGGKLAEMELEERRGDASYTEFEKMFASGVVGVAEGLSEKISLGQIKKMKRVFKSAKRADLVKGVTKYYVNQAKILGKDMAQEASSEGAAQLAENVVDKFFLDKDIKLSRGLGDAMASGAFMSVMYKSPLLVKEAKRLLPKSVNTKFEEASVEIRKINKELLKEDLSDSARKILTDKRDVLAKKSAKLFERATKKVDGMSEEGKKSLLKIYEGQANLKEDIKNILSDDSLSDDVKKSLIEDFKNKYIALENDKAKLYEEVDTKDNGSKQEVAEKEGTVPETTTETTTTESEKGVDKGAEGGDKVQGENGAELSVVGDGKGVQQDSDGVEVTEPSKEKQLEEVKKGDVITSDMIVRDDLSEQDGVFIGDMIDEGNKDSKKTKILKVNGTSERGTSVDIRVVKNDGVFTETVFIKPKNTISKTTDTQVDTIAENVAEELELDNISKIDISESVGLNKVTDLVNNLEDSLNNYGKTHASMGLPIVTAQAIVKAMKIAIKTAKTSADIVSAGLNALKNSDWYKEQNDKNRRYSEKNFIKMIHEAGKGKEVNKAVTKPSEVKPKKTSTKAQVRKSTGQTDTSKKVVTTEKKALRDKLRTEARAATKAYKEGRKSLKEAKKKLTKFIFDKLGKDGLTPAEFKSIARRIRDVDEVNFYDLREEVVNLIEDRIETRQTRGRIHKLKAKLRRASKKTAKSPDNVKELAKKSTYIDARYLSKESLEEYEDVLSKIHSSTVASSSDKYKVVEVDKAYEKLDKLFEESDKNRNKFLAKELNLEGAGLSTAELESILKADNFTEEAEKLKAEKKKKFREALTSSVNNRSEQLKEKLKEDGLTPEQKRDIKTLIDPNTDTMSLSDLNNYVKIADNIIHNNSFNSSYNTITSKVKTDKAAEDFAEYMNKTRKGKESIRLVKKNKLTEAKDFSLIMKQMFGSTVAAAKFNLESGLYHLSRAYEKVKRRVTKVENNYDKLIKKLKKKNKNINKAESVIKRGIISNLIQGDTAKDFEINKARVESTIESLKGSYKTAEQQKIVEELYEDLKELNSQEEVIQYAKDLGDGTYEILDFWMKEFDSIKDDLKKNTEEVFGERFSEVTSNYLPVGTITTKSLKKESEEEARPAFVNNIPTPKQSPTTMARVKSKMLPKDYMLNLDFDSVMFNKYEQSIYDIEASRSAFDVKNFFSSDAVAKLIGKDNARLMSYNVNRALKIQRGLVQYDKSETAKTMLKISSTVKKIAAIQALGTALAYPKQYFGVIANAIVRLGAKDSVLMFDAIHELSFGKSMEIVEEALARRGELEGGTRNAYEKPSAAEKKAISSMASGIAKKTGVQLNKVRGGLFASLRKGDTHAAKATWIAYYKQYLKNKGYDLKRDVDMSTEHLKIEDDKVRQEAASYAQQNVEETQIATDESRESELYAKDQASLVKFMKDIILPYSRFVLQAKMRMMIDVSNVARSVKRGDMENTEASVKSLIGTATEQVVFHGINYFILKPFVHKMFELAKDLIWDDDSDDEEYDWDFKIKQLQSKLATDLNPLAVGNGLETLQIELMNYVDYLKANSKGEFENQAEYEKFNKSIGEDTRWYRYGDEYGFDFDLVKDLGVYQGAIDIFGGLYDSGQYAFSEYPEVEGYYGNTDVIDKDSLLDSEKTFLKLAFFVELLSSIGAMEAETYRAIKKEQRAIIKYAPKN